MTPDRLTDAVQATRELYDRLINAWNKRNAREFAISFSTNGNMIGFDGSQIDGQSEIGKHISGVFSHHQTAAFVTIVREIRELADGVALLRANVGMVPPRKTDLNPETNAAQTMVAVRDGAEWKVALFQNTPSAFHGRPEDSSQLSEELRQAMRAQIEKPG